jgi:hypothetical protein
VDADAPDERLVTFPSAHLYHRGDCVLGTGKEPQPVSSPDALRPCPVCEPVVV